MKRDSSESGSAVPNEAVPVSRIGCSVKRCGSRLAREFGADGWEGKVTYEGLSHQTKGVGW